MTVEPSTLDDAAGKLHSIDVWRIDVESMRADMPALAASLSDAERQRAQRFRSEADHRRFVIAHAALRRVLASRLAMAPADIHFDEGEHGKPTLHAGSGPPWFNLSHSGRWALCALCEAAPVGVDVEQPRDSPDHLAVARRWFARSECDALEALPGERLGACFRRLWVCKEALLKSDGRGISGGLQRFELELTASDVRLLRVAGSADSASQWSLETFALAGGYCGAVAAPMPGLRTRFHDFDLGGKNELADAG